MTMVASNTNACAIFVTRSYLVGRSGADKQEGRTNS